MSDLRDFNGTSTTTIGNSPIGDSTIGGVPLSQEGGRDDGAFIDRPAAFDESAGSEPLNQFHVVEEEEPGSNTIKIAGAFAVALLVGAAAVYGYEISSSPSNKAAMTQTAANTPAPAPAMTPPPSAPSAASDNSSSSTTMTPPASQAAAAPAKTSQPVVRSARRSARAPSAETTASLATPPVEPVSPTPPASSLAGNPNPQPALSAPDEAAPAPDASAQPAPQAAAPAPESTPAVPPPDQAPAQ